MHQQRKIPVGVSACLLGERVRYDGGHKHQRFLTESLGEHFRWVPVCPEVEIGMGTPREAIHLVQLDGDVRLKTSRSNADITDTMRDYARCRVEQLAEARLCGYVLKKDSPSCGMQRVKVRDSSGMPRREGTGLFAAALIERFPNLPIEEEGRLCDPRLRENWVERVFAYHALQQLWATDWNLNDLVQFHTRYKYALLAHNEPLYRQLGRLVASSKSYDRCELKEQYESLFMENLRTVATVKKNVNALQHMIGFFARQLDAESRDELWQHVDDYRRGLTPLVVPMAIVHHYVRVLNVDYLRRQVYLAPHPRELALRAYV